MTYNKKDFKKNTCLGREYIFSDFHVGSKLSSSNISSIQTVICFFRFKYVSTESLLPI